MRPKDLQNPYGNGPVLCEPHLLEEFSGSSEIASRNGLPHFAVTGASTSGAPGGESAAGEHLEADPRRAERDFVTANFRECTFSRHFGA
jgi:hypothetical protein